MKATKKTINEAVQQHADFLKTLETQQEINTWAISLFGLIHPPAHSTFRNYLNEALAKIGINHEELDSEMSFGNVIRYMAKVEKWNSEQK